MAEDPTTWTDLKTALATWSVRTDWTTLIPVAIAFAEREFQRTVFCPEREETVALTFSAESSALPADFWGVMTAYWSASSVKYLLEYRTMNALREDYPSTATGTPRFYSLEGEYMFLGPPPSSGTVELTYWETIPVLNSGNATNWLLTDHPDLYLAGSLAWLFKYARDWEAQREWAATAALLTKTINKTGRDRRNNSGPVAARPANTDQILSYTR